MSLAALAREAVVVVSSGRAWITFAAIAVPLGIFGVLAIARRGDRGLAELERVAIPLEPSGSRPSAGSRASGRRRGRRAAIEARLARLSVSQDVSQVDVARSEGDGTSGTRVGETRVAGEPGPRGGGETRVAGERDSARSHEVERLRAQLALFSPLDSSRALDVAGQERLARVAAALVRIEARVVLRAIDGGELLRVAPSGPASAEQSSSEGELWFEDLRVAWGVAISPRRIISRAEPFLLPPAGVVEIPSRGRFRRELRVEALPTRRSPPPGAPGPRIAVLVRLDSLRVDESSWLLRAETGGPLPGVTPIARSDLTARIGTPGPGLPAGLETLHEPAVILAPVDLALWPAVLRRRSTTWLELDAEPDAPVLLGAPLLDENAHWLGLLAVEPSGSSPSLVAAAAERMLWLLDGESRVDGAPEPGPR